MKMPSKLETLCGLRKKFVGQTRVVPSKKAGYRRPQNRREISE
jgi:hypothetical protein